MEQRDAVKVYIVLIFTLNRVGRRKRMACLMENYNRVKAQSAVGEAPFSCKLCFCKILAKIKFILLPRGTYIYIYPIFFLYGNGV